MLTRTSRFSNRLKRNTLGLSEIKGNGRRLSFVVIGMLVL
jgi:hypothetical protein